MNQPRVCLPGRGDHKPSFGAVRSGGSRRKGVEPGSLKGRLSLLHLVEVEVGLLCQEAVGACLLEPVQDFLPPLGNVGNCQG